MYLFYAYLIENELYTLGETWAWVTVVCVGCVVLAYGCLKLYDIPVRDYLSTRLLKKREKTHSK
jgi:hypothetical protein